MTNQIFNFRADLEAQLAAHEKASIEIKHELEALDLLERSKYAKFKINNTSQQNLFPKITIKNRILKAIDMMPEKFTRKQLLEIINKDGNNEEVVLSTFSVFFARFIKEGKIELFEKGGGNKVNYYSRKKEPVRVLRIE